MNLVVRISIYLYSRLLRLYPPGFRHEFADEMLTVFTAALTDAQGRGRLSMAIWCGREFMGLLSTIVKEKLNALRQKERPIYPDLPGQIYCRCRKLPIPRIRWSECYAESIEHYPA